MKALIDADLLVYEYSSDEVHGFKVSLDQAKERLSNKIEKVTKAAECDEYTCYLTNSPTNFRLELATIQPYKGNRTAPKPPYWLALRNYLLDEHDAVMVSGMEADDQMSIEQHKDLAQIDSTVRDVPLYGMTVICSRDKDLDTVPGHHYSWQAGKQEEKPLYFITELDGLKNFYSQLLTGDSVDNIPGLYGVGKVKAKRALGGCESELELYKACRWWYERYFGSYWELFLVENAQLLHMRRTLNDVWRIPEDGRMVEREEF